MPSTKEKMERKGKNKLPLELFLCNKPSSTQPQEEATHQLFKEMNQTLRHHKTVMKTRTIDINNCYLKNHNEESEYSHKQTLNSQSCSIFQKAI